MEYSLDSNPILLVPPSPEDSESNITTDDPLGRGEDSQLDFSQSVHIKETENNTISSSPGAMHIDLAETPSACSSTGIMAASPSSESNSADKDPGKMSPDLITSSEISSADLISNTPRSHGSDDSEIPSSEKEIEPSLTKKLSDEADIISSSNENIFEAETQAYSESGFSISEPPKNIEQNPGCTSVLQKLGCDDVTSTPVILTASTQTDSENGKNLGDDFLSVLSAKHQEASKLDVFTAKRSVDETMDIDSQEIIVKDVSMRSGSEESSSNSPKVAVAGPEKYSQIAGEGIELQAYSQEELHLHLTFESQLFDGSSLPDADSQSLVVDERSQSKTPAVVNNNHIDPIPVGQDCLLEPDAPPVAHNVSDSTCDASEEANNSRDDSVADNLPGATKSALEEVDNVKEDPAGSVAHASETTNSELEESCNKVDNHAGAASDGTCEIINSAPERLPSEENQFDESVSLNAIEDNITQVGENEKSPPIQSKTTLTSDDHCGSYTDVDSTKKNGGHDSDGALEVFETTNGQKMSLEVSDQTEKSISTDLAPTGSEEPEKGLKPIPKSECDMPKDDKEQPSSSLQSTYIDENATHPTLSESIIVSSQSVSCSYDASVENSSMDREEETAGDPIADLETQPFTPTPREESSGEKEDLEKETKKCKDKQEEKLTREENENNIRPLVQKIIDTINTDLETVGTVETSVAVEEFEDSGAQGPTTDTLSKTATLDKELVVKVYDFRSQSQPSQDIQLKAQFREPTSLTMKEQSRGRGRPRKGTSKNSMSQANKDGKNNAAGDLKGEKTEEHDKSSDTLPPNDSSDSEPLISPGKEGLMYRVTKTTLIETIKNGKVIDSKTIQKKPKICKKPPLPYMPQHSSQSSNGSGYLADTSSLSRTSSDTSTQTDFSHSPGGRLRLNLEPALQTELSGSSNSSSGSSTAFVTPIHPPKTTKTMKSPGSKSGKIANSPKKTSSSSSPAQSAVMILSTSLSSPALKRSRVVLTPLSTELIGSKFSVDIATPPLCNINPPLSGSTPVEILESDHSNSGITAPNSPEIGYPMDSVQETPFQLDGKSRSGMRKNPQKLKTHTEHPSPQEMISFGEGIPVMARLPTEPYFYPGMMRAQDPKSAKYLVHFDDDSKERQIRERDVLMIDRLNVGQRVLVQSDSDWYSPGTILSCWRENDERGYVIETSGSVAARTKTSRKYSRKQVVVKQECLTEDQKNSFVQPLSGASADVSLDNVVDGKRRTRRSAASATSSPASKGGSPSLKVSKTPKSSRKRRASDSQSSASSACVPFPSKAKRAKLTYGSGRKTPSKKGRKSSSRTGAVEYKESKIFKNCGFLLTSTTGQDHPSSEFDSPPCNTQGYDRDVTRRKIVAGSGLVVKDFTKLMSCDCKSVYVISDSDCRTMNYFNALAAGICCLSYIWIDNSTNLGKMQPTSKYKLPAGYSLLQQGIVERPKVPVHPLSSLRVSLQMKDPAMWSPLLCLAGCNMVSTRQDTLKDDCPLSCDVVVADNSCSEMLMERARSLKIPTVSIEWVIQCLIDGKKLSYDARPEFKSFT